MDKAQREERLAFYEEAARHTPILAVPVRDATFLVETADLTVGRALFLKRHRREFGVLARAVGLLDVLRPKTQPGRGTFVDIGANIGTSVVPALRTHGFTRAVACEPAPSNYRLLKANLLLNDVADRARTLPVAVSDKAGPVKLLLHGRNSGGHHVAFEGPPDNGAITVDGVTLDLLVSRGFFEPAAVGLLWLDVQGYEGHVLRGATALYRSGVPIVLELEPTMLERARGLSSVLEIVGEHYTHFVDLRDVGDGPRLRRVAGIASFASALQENDRHTDILLARLKPGNVRALSKATDAKA